jgi:hypothetical protein
LRLILHSFPVALPAANRDGRRVIVPRPWRRASKARAPSYA